MNKHTPGPWAINKDSLGDLLPGCVNIDAHSHKALATAVYQMEDDAGHADDLAGSDVCRANALLISAAPDLLEALRQMINLFEASIPDRFNPDFYEEWIFAQAAIAKATGESHAS